MPDKHMKIPGFESVDDDENDSEEEDEEEVYDYGDTYEDYIEGDDMDLDIEASS